MAEIDVDNLKSVREALVEKRRAAFNTSIEIALANKEPRPSTNWAQEITLIQGHIEALDRAIEDEKKLRGPTTSSVAFIG